MRKKRNAAFVDEIKLLLQKKQSPVGSPGPDASGSTPVETDKPSPVLQELRDFDHTLDDAIAAWVPTHNR